MIDTAFLDIGRHCSEKSCNQLDFLPFQCPACDSDFCSEHWRPSLGHSCPKHDSSRDDNRIPSCPLCSIPVPFPPGTDPNLAMDTHLTSHCLTLNPHLALLPKPKPANECRAPRCKTKMIVPIQCEKCRDRFCPKHRFERDHACKGMGAETVKAAGSGGAAKKALGVFGSSSAGGSGAGKAKTSLTGLAALRRAQQAASSSTSSSSSSKPAPSKPFAKPTPSSKPSPGALGSASNPIVLTDTDSDVEIVSPLPSSSASKPRKPSFSNGGKKALASAGVMGKPTKRALQEQESATKALEARAKKGLLTEDEKLRYATLQAMAAKNGGKGGDGCVMA